MAHPLDKQHGEWREKRLFIGETQMLYLFRKRMAEVELGIDFPGLPEDIQVTAVHYEHAVRGWYLYVSHPSFPVVPEGDPIPLASAIFTPRLIPALPLLQEPCVIHEES